MGELDAMYLHSKGWGSPSGPLARLDHLMTLLLATSTVLVRHGGCVVKDLLKSYRIQNE